MVPTPPQPQRESDADPSLESAALHAIDFVPQVSVSIGVATTVLSLALFALGSSDTADGIPLMVLLLLATLGLTLGLCAVLLAFRDKRNLGFAWAGVAANLPLPAYLLAGMPWS